VFGFCKYNNNLPNCNKKLQNLEKFIFCSAFYFPAVAAEAIPAAIPVVLPYFFKGNRPNPLKQKKMLLFFL